MPSPALLSVDLNALARNFHTLEAVTGAPVHPVVKADAYGLGAEACATRLMTEGARTFFVARADEGPDGGKDRHRSANGGHDLGYIVANAM